MFRLFKFFSFFSRSAKLTANVWVLAMLGHLEIASLTFAEMLNRITKVEYTTVSPTIANTMLAAVGFYCNGLS